MSINSAIQFAIMRRVPLPGRLVLFLVTLVAWLAPFSQAQAQLSVTESQVIIPERGPVACLRIVADGGAFTLIPPPGWRPSVQSGEKKLTFVSSNQLAVITMTFAGPNTALTPELDLDALQAAVLARFPGGNVLSHFTSSTGYARGEGFEVAWRSGAGQPFVTRLALVPCPGGVIEIALTGSRREVDAQRAPFAWFLNSLSRTASK